MLRSYRKVTEELASHFANVSRLRGLRHLYREMSSHVNVRVDCGTLIDLP